ncbi:hypothetical protein H6P81_004721 [Aristolochia fimbriata]|uniref:Uncharacterized protein n=1 Tax=Aristolochia fimbriata TaxID=158543 RepID=A0AAV7EW12_ARIFI|nr:hypothetical protein H6P81_004721 [Aristolochia fimbriata]
MNPNNLFSSGMSSSNGVGVMAVVAISGSVVLVAMQMHKRLVAEFMKKVEFQMGGEKHRQQKKKVRFADTVSTPSSSTGNSSHRAAHRPPRPAAGGRHVATKNRDATSSPSSEQETLSKIPANRLALYRGIMEYNRSIRGRSASYS